MKVDSLNIGILTLIAEHTGPFLKVGVRSPSGAEHGELHMTLGEWHSLRATADVLAAADRRHAEDQSRIADLEHELAAAIRWIESTQFRVSDSAHRVFAEHLKKTLDPSREQAKEKP